MPRANHCQSLPESDQTWPSFPGSRSHVRRPGPRHLLHQLTTDQAIYSYLYCLLLGCHYGAIFRLNVAIQLCILLHVAL